jgi:hypothetical protein
LLKGWRRVTFDLPFGILERELNDIVTLTEASLPAACAWRSRPRTASPKVWKGVARGGRHCATGCRRAAVCVMSGGNISDQHLTRVLVIDRLRIRIGGQGSENGPIVRLFPAP